MNIAESLSQIASLIILALIILLIVLGKDIPRG